MTFYAPCQYEEPIRSVALNTDWVKVAIFNLTVVVIGNLRFLLMILWMIVYEKESITFILPNDRECLIKLHGAYSTCAQCLHHLQ